MLQEFIIDFPKPGDVHPYIMIYNLKNQQIFSDIRDFFIAMTIGMNIPVFVMGRDTYIRIFNRKEEIEQYELQKVDFLEEENSNYKIIIILNHLINDRYNFNEKSQVLNSNGNENNRKRTRSYMREEEKQKDYEPRPKVDNNLYEKLYNISEDKYLCPVGTNENYPAPIEGIGFKRWFIQGYARSKGQKWILTLDQNCGPVEKCVINENFRIKPFEKIGKCPNQCFIDYTETINEMNKAIKENQQKLLSININKGVGIWGIRNGLEGSPRTLFNKTGSIYKFVLQNLDIITPNIQYKKELAYFAEDFDFVKQLELEGLSSIKIGFLSLIRTDENLINIKNCQENINFSLVEKYQKVLKAFQSNKNIESLDTAYKKYMKDQGYLLGWKISDYCETYKKLQIYTLQSGKDPLLPVLNIKVNAKLYQSIMDKDSEMSVYYLGSTQASNFISNKFINPKAYEIISGKISKDINQGEYQDPEPKRLKSEESTQKISLSSNKYARNWIFIDVYMRVLIYLKFLVESNTIDNYKITSKEKEIIIEFFKPFPKERDFLNRYIEDNKDKIIRNA